MYNYLNKPPKTAYQIIAETFLIVFMTAILFLIATSCKTVKNATTAHPCCNKEVCEQRRVLLINGAFHVYHNDGTGYTFIGKLKTQE